MEMMMVNDPMTNFEIPTEMRQVAEKSLEDARKAFDGFIAAAQKAAAEIEEQATLAQAGAKDVGKRAMAFAEQNVATSFEFAQKLTRAKNAEEIMRLQAEFVKTQMHVLSDQDRKSTRLNSSHPSISYAVFCLKKKKQQHDHYSYVKKKKKKKKKTQ